MDIRNKIVLGNNVLYNKKNYVVCGLWFDLGGHVMVADLVRPTEGDNFRFVKHIYDEQIENCIIITP